MKLCKVKIIKKRGEGRTDFVYPEGYDAHIASPFIYQNEGKDLEFCLATVPDDFKFTEDMAEITTELAEATVETWIDDDKDIKTVVTNDKIDAERLIEIKENKKKCCQLS